MFSRYRIHGQLAFPVGGARLQSDHTCFYPFASTCERHGKRPPILSPSRTSRGSPGLGCRLAALERGRKIHRFGDLGSLGYGAIGGLERFLTNLSVLTLMNNSACPY
jgi:hypothetical protein